MKNNLKFLLPLTPYLTSQIDTIFLTFVAAPILQLSGLQAQEKQLSQLGDQNVTLKEELADLKSRSVFFVV